MLLILLLLRMNSTYLLWVKMKVAPARPPKALTKRLGNDE